MDGFAKELESSKNELSPWVTLVEWKVELPGGRTEVFHSFELAETADKKAPLVRQYWAAC